MTIKIERAAPFRGIDEWALTARGAEWHVLISEGEPVLRGHYPGQPILPGIYTFESLSQGVERVFAGRGMRARVRLIKSMRFLLPFGPGSRLRIVADIGEADAAGDYPVAATLYRGQDKAASAKLLFAVEALAHA